MPDDHGTRRCYASGCRCVRCRAANARYANAHRIAGELVASSAARLHLEQLAAAGVGIRQASTLTGLAASTLAAIRAGTVATIRPSTAAAILAATPQLAAGALVPATKTWRYLDSLHREGYTRREIAWHLGATSQQLQLAPRLCRLSTARHVAAVYSRLAAI